MFAKENNMGDISGKMVSQYTTSNLLGISFGMFMSKFVLNVGEISQLLPSFAVLTAASIYFNYLSVTVIDEAFVNKVRAGIVMEAYLKNK